MPPRRRRRWLRRTLTGLLVVALLSTTPILLRAVRADRAAPAVVASEVTVSGTRFGPPAVTIAAGEAVTFTWSDGTTHDVLFADGVGIEPRRDGSWSRTFEEPGTYPFRCTLHPFMDGRVEVQPAASR